MSGPIILTVPGMPLYRQVITYLATDTDPTQGLVAALGNGVSSIYPNFLTDGPTPDRTLCPTPFLIVTPGDMRAKDDRVREWRIVVEVHDDEDQGDQRWPGLLLRVKSWLCVEEYRPVADAAALYRSGLMFEGESPPNLPDTRYQTQVVQAQFLCRGLDRTSGHGSNG